MVLAIRNLDTASVNPTTGSVSLPVDDSFVPEDIISSVSVPKYEVDTAVLTSVLRYLLNNYFISHSLL